MNSHSRVARFFGLLLFLGIMAGIIYAARVFERWNTPGDLAPSGGRYFFSRVEIPVPLFQQGDPRWAHDPLGPGPTTLAAEGCAISSAAMVLASYGIDTDPQRLNELGQSRGAFSPRGWLYWEICEAIPESGVVKAYEGPATYYLIDQNLARGNPVIVRLRNPHGPSTHFVVLAGKDGFDYLVRDPGSGGKKGLYPLREYGSPIEALRIYQKGS
ncbi:MAG: C39 family peptidase [Chthoniobacteraceae bacterium]